ncbi:MAG: acyltransferase [Paracoccaceae bacterium]|nr:acyltransferase [Paracoccaceae bacterium]
MPTLAVPAETDRVTRAEAAPIHAIQWIRIYLVALVVTHHAAIPYTHVGLWPVSDPAKTEGLIYFLGINAAYFMGFFFLIAGYFTEASYDRRGFWRFLRRRVERLLVPLVVLVLLVTPAIGWLWSPDKPPLLAHWRAHFADGVEFGPLWFIAHLFVYSALYALWRALTGPAGPVRPPPGFAPVLAYVLTLALATAAIRAVWPQDVWIDIAGIVPAEPAHFPQYASLFVVGIVAGRSRWFETFDTRQAGACFAIGVATYLAFVAFVALSGDPLFFERQWFVYGWAAVEAPIAVGMIFGICAVARRWVSRPGPVLGALQGQVYGVYLIHVYVLVAVQTALLSAPYGAWTKFAVATFAGLALSFAVVALLRRVPAIRAAI